MTHRFFCRAILSVAIVFFATAPLVVASADSEYKAGLAAYQRRDYKTAAKCFENACSQGLSTPTVLLYCGHAHLANRDNENALKAYMKLKQIYPRSAEAKMAEQGMAKTGSAGAVPAAAKNVPLSKLPATSGTGSTRRWLATTMPVRVYVASGQQLPADIRGNILTRPQYDVMCESLKQPGWVQRLDVHPRYQSDDSRAVVDGLNLWSGQRYVTFTSTGRAADADIVVFFADKIHSNLAGFCQNPGTLAQPCLIQLGLDTKERHAHHWSKVLTATACHEFGHAFGLDHSNNVDDVMYGNEAPTSSELAHERKPTSNDLETLRRLYSVPPTWWMGRLK